MDDPKNEQLATNQFICKVCWEKKTNIRIQIHIQDCDMGSWSDCGPGFCVCEDCWVDMCGAIDLKADEILYNIVGNDKNIKMTHEYRLLRTLVERRIDAMNTLKEALTERIPKRGCPGIKGDQHDGQ